MGNNNKNTNKKRNNETVNFFQFTREQLFLNLEKYDFVSKNNPNSLLGTNPIKQNESSSSANVYQKRLNSIDTSMLEDVAYTVLDDENLKLEKKIEDTEKILKELTEKLIVADTIQDIERKKELIYQRKALLTQRTNLLEQYKTKNVLTQFTTIYTKLIKLPYILNEKFRKKIKKIVKNSVILKKIKPLMRTIIVRDTLNRLHKINKSVDELVMMKVPFGEQEAKYDALINHLSRATALQAQIRKELEK